MGVVFVFLDVDLPITPVSLQFMKCPTDLQTTHRLLYRLPPEVMDTPDLQHDLAPEGGGVALWVQTLPL